MVWGHQFAHVVEQYALDATRTLTGSYYIHGIYIQNTSGAAATVSIKNAAGTITYWVIPFAADGVASIEVAFLADKGLQFSAASQAAAVLVTVLRGQDGA